MSFSQKSSEGSMKENKMYFWNILPWRYRIKLQKYRFSRRGVVVDKAPNVTGQLPDLLINGACIIGNNCHFRSFRTRQRIRVDSGAELSLGDNCFINDAVTICATKQISIGNNVKLGDQVHIYDSDFHQVSPDRDVEQGAIKIANNVWIGAKVMILAGSTIGDNSVIAAGSVVRGIIPPNCVAGGMPAKVIKYFDVAPGWIRR
jgi:acetyltransferase-like isoleucine patch superfamily enzyme